MNPCKSVWGLLIFKDISVARVKNHLDGCTPSGFLSCLKGRDVQVSIQVLFTTVQEKIRK